MHVVALALQPGPLAVLRALADEPGAVSIEVPDAERPLTILGCRPSARLTIRADGVPERDDGRTPPREPLAAIAEFVAEGAAGTRALPFPLGANVVGVLAYELGQVIEARPAAAPRGNVPLAVLARYDTLLVYDHRRTQYLLVSAREDTAPVPWLDHLIARAPDVREGPLWAASPLIPLLSHEHYLRAVARISDYLSAGDVYQVNLTLPYEARLLGSPYELYARLTRRHPMPYGAYVDLGCVQLIANSPELFLRRRGDRLVTRPIKGTRPRGRTPAEDAALAAELRADPKEQAEHVMIVDLERNDLGRLCRPGSVVVEEFARVERHPTVHHLVSTVAGRARDGVGLADVLRATFPGGSITGAPKLRAMEIIGELEPWARGYYTGAFGLFHPDGDLELGLAIRTAVVRGDVLRYHAGGGIVADSVPEREYAEAWLKTAALRLALGEADEPGLAACSSG